MINNKLKNITIDEKSTIEKALKKIKLNGQGTCFVTDKRNKIIGIVTDGDIRKLILRKVSIKTQIKKYFNNNFFSMPSETEGHEARNKLKKGRKIIPLVNKQGILTDYVSLTKNKEIPLVKPDLNGNEKNYLIDCINSTFVSSKGKYISLFEKKFRNYYKANYSLAVSSCTAGLTLALSSLKLNKTDEVIVPNVTFVSPINSIIHNYARPVLCDVNEKNFTIDLNSLKKLINKKTKAIICVHIYGHPCDMDEIQKLIKNKGIFLIEDCAEAIGTKYKNKKIGSFGDCSVFSFFGNKTLTTGEGGMILFKKKENYLRCLNLRDHGMDTKKKYWHDNVGYNFRMTNMQAALGVAQMEKINLLIKTKIDIAKTYNKYLKNFEKIVIPKTEKWASHSFWLYNIIIKDGNEKGRDNLIFKLSQAGIEARPMFYPASDMKIYSKFKKDINYSKISYKGLSLPSYIGLSNEEIKFTCSKLKSLIF